MYGKKRAGLMLLSLLEKPPKTRNGDKIDNQHSQNLVVVTGLIQLLFTFISKVQISHPLWKKLQINKKFE